MNVLIISRSESKLKEQMEELKNDHKTNIRYMAFDFTERGTKRDDFYVALKKECEDMDKDGGIGLLINNVGIANQYPQREDELEDKETADMLTCNIDSVVFMTRTMLPFMMNRKKGAILNLSSGSGNLPSPYIATYSATKYVDVYIFFYSLCFMLSVLIYFCVL